MSEKRKKTFLSGRKKNTKLLSDFQKEQIIKQEDSPSVNFEKSNVNQQNPIISDNQSKKSLSYTFQQKKTVTLNNDLVDNTNVEHENSVHYTDNQYYIQNNLDDKINTLEINDSDSVGEYLSEHKLLNEHSEFAQVSDTLSESLIFKPHISHRPEITCGPLTTVSRQAMASDFEISLNTEEDADKMDAVLDALDEIERLEELFSIFRPLSFLNRINALASEYPFSVDEDIASVLDFCLPLSKESQGAYDLTSSPLSKAWGFFRRQGFFPERSEIQKAMELMGYQHIVWNPEEQTVFFQKEGLTLNFGSVGKGKALDNAGMILTKMNVENYLIHGGKSSILACGGRKGDKTLDGEPCWTIGIAHPLRAQKRLAEITLTDQGLGTSGTQYQFFRFQGKRYSHILDPRTGFPTEGVLSVTVIGPDAMSADALSTAFFVLGPAATESYLQRHPEYSVLFVLESSGSSGFELVPLNINPRRFRLVDAW